MPYMVWKWVCTECNMNGSEFYALSQSRLADVKKNYGF